MEAAKYLLRDSWPVLLIAIAHASDTVIGRFQFQVSNGLVERQIVEDWIRLFDNTCCRRSKTVERLRAFLAHCDDPVRWPPRPPYVPGEIPHEVILRSAPSMLLNDAEANQVVAANASYLATDHAAPLARYFDELDVYLAYVAGYGHPRGRSPPSAPIGFDQVKMMARVFFGYRCEKCHRSFSAIDQVQLPTARASHLNRSARLDQYSSIPVQVPLYHRDMFPAGEGVRPGARRGVVRDSRTSNRSGEGMSRQTLCEQGRRR